MRDRRAAFVSNRLDSKQRPGDSATAGIAGRARQAWQAVASRNWRCLPVSLRPWGAWGEWQGPMASGLVPSWHWLGLQLPVCNAPGAEKLPSPPRVLADPVRPGPRSSGPPSTVGWAGAQSVWACHLLPT